MRVVQENFIDDQRQMVFAAKNIQLVAFRAVYVGTGGVVGMHDHHGAGARIHRSVERGKVDLPAVVVKQRIGHQLHVL
jgi:hypothetical protein